MKYDPKIYNFYNLADDDKAILYWCKKMMDAVVYYRDYDEDFEVDDQKDWHSIYVKIATDTLSNALLVMSNELVEMIVGWIDGYNYDVTEQNTDDYFYGFKEFCEKVEK